MNELVLLKRGLESFRLRAYRDAETYFREALAENPTSVDAAFHLGRSLVYINREDDAAEYFKRVLEINPAYVSNWVNRAHFCDGKGYTAAADACLLAELVTEHERDDGIRKDLAELFYDIRGEFLKNRCFDESIGVEGNIPGETQKPAKVAVQRTNCHVTTH